MMEEKKREILYLLYYSAYLLALPFFISPRNKEVEDENGSGAEISLLNT